VRTLLLFTALLAGSLHAQSPSPAPTDLRQALIGEWTGVLEYRDYSEPPTSTKRVQLPTWLSITALGDKLSEHFIYDDGPTKTVEETDVVTLDTTASTYSESDNGKPAQVFRVIGYDKLKNGRGEIILSGTGTDNDKPSETRITLTVRRNLLTWIEEVRPAGSAEAFVFRHRFTFTRANPPTLPTVHQ
jgi:hypothetical protein